MQTALQRWPIRRQTRGIGQHFPVIQGLASSNVTLPIGSPWMASCLTSIESDPYSAPLKRHAASNMICLTSTSRRPCNRTIIPLNVNLRSGQPSKLNEMVYNTIAVVCKRAQTSTKQVYRTTAVLAFFSLRLQMSQ